MRRFVEVDVLADAVLAGAVAWAVIVILEAVLSSDSSSGARDDRYPVLTEAHLDRLEDGKTVVVPRWHGNDLELSAVDGGESTAA